MTTASSALTWLATKTAGPSRSSTCWRLRTVRRQKLDSAGNMRLDCSAARTRRMLRVLAQVASSSVGVSTNESVGAFGSRESAVPCVGAERVEQVHEDHLDRARVVRGSLAFKDDVDTTIVVVRTQLIGQLLRSVLEHTAAAVAVVVDLLCF